MKVGKRPSQLFPPKLNSPVSMCNGCREVISLSRLIGLACGVSGYKTGRNTVEYFKVAWADLLDNAW